MNFKVKTMQEREDLTRDTHSVSMHGKTKDNCEVFVCYIELRVRMQTIGLDEY